MTPPIAPEGSSAAVPKQPEDGLAGGAGSTAGDGKDEAAVEADGLKGPPDLAEIDRLLWEAAELLGPGGLDLPRARERIKLRIRELAEEDSREKPADGASES